MKADKIIDAIEAVTKKWAKQRKAEERHAAAVANRRHVMTRSYDRVTIKDAAWDVMREAYLKVSGPRPGQPRCFRRRPHQGAGEHCASALKDLQKPSE